MDHRHQCRLPGWLGEPRLRFAAERRAVFPGGVSVAADITRRNWRMEDEGSRMDGASTLHSAVAEDGRQSSTAWSVCWRKADKTTQKSSRAPDAPHHALGRSRTGSIPSALNRPLLK